MGGGGLLLSPLLLQEDSWGTIHCRLLQEKGNLRACVICATCVIWAHLYAAHSIPRSVVQPLLVWLPRLSACMSKEALWRMWQQFKENRGCVTAARGFYLTQTGLVTEMIHLRRSFSQFFCSNKQHSINIQEIKVRYRLRFSCNGANRAQLVNQKSKLPPGVCVSEWCVSVCPVVDWWIDTPGEIRNQCMCALLSILVFY